MKLIHNEDLLSLDMEHIWHPYTQHALAPSPFLVTKAENEYIYIEDQNGQERKLIDGISSWWVNIHGHSNKYINERIKAQLDKFEHVIFANLTHEPAIKLVEELLPLLPNKELNYQGNRNRQLRKAFFSDNGSTAVEVGIKMAIQHFYNQGQEKRNRIIAFKDSYHGDTVGTMSIGDTPTFHQAFKTLLYPVDFVSNASPRTINFNPKLNADEREQVKLEAYQAAEEKSLEEIQALITKYPQEIAAIIIEPLVQGAGGMKFHRAEFLQKLRKISQDSGIILIADEVFTGFGRTGDHFACSKANIIPDIICLSKGLTGGYLPLGLTVTNEEIYSAFHSESKLKTFFHGHSFTGNPLSCTAALASLELYKKEKRLEDISYINSRMKQELSELEDLEHIADLRIIGAIAVIEFKSQEGYLDNIGAKLTEKFLDSGLLLRPLGNVLYFLPPYTISVEALDYSLKTIRRHCEEGIDT